MGFSSDQGTQFTGQIIQALTKTLQTSWNYHCPCHSQLSGKDNRTSGKTELKEQEELIYGVEWTNEYGYSFYYFLSKIFILVFSRGQVFATLWTRACQVPLSTGFFKQECWSGLPFPTPGDLPDPRNKPTSLMSPALTGRVFATVPLGKRVWNMTNI